MGKGSRIESEKRLRLQCFDAEKAEIEDRAIQKTRRNEARQKQRIGPDRGADGQSRDRPARVRPPPEQPPEESRAELRYRGKGEEADLGELTLAREVIIEIGQQQNSEDAKTARREQRRAHVG